MALEDLERELFSRRSRGSRPQEKPRGEKPHTVSSAPEPVQLPREAQEPPLTFQERMRLITRSVMLAAVTVLLAAGAVGGVLYAFFSREASRGITLSVEVPEKVMSGVPFDLVVNAENEIDAVVRDATVTLNLPERVVALGTFAPTSARVEESIGDIGGNSVARKTFRLVAVGDPGEEKEIGVSIGYVSGGRNRFRADETAAVVIGEPAIKVTASVPERVIGNSSFEFTVTYRNVSSFDFTGVTLEVGYPSSFLFESASFPPDSLNNYWRLGALNAGSEGSLIIKGSATASGEQSLTFPIAVSANFFGKDYRVLDTEVRVALAPSPFVLTATVNGSSNYVARAGDLLTYLIRYENRSGVALADVVVRATLAGEMFDVGAASTEGRVDATARTVTWDAGNVPAFRLLDAGATGELVLTVPLRSSFPIRRLSDKHFSVRLTATAESPTVPAYLAAAKTAATTVLETKLAGAAAVEAYARYRDAGSGFVNAGALPPRVGNPTEYVIHWVVTNFSTDVERVSVRALLPPEVVWTGQVKSNSDSVPLFEEATREVIWRIDKIPATKGVIGAPLEAMFQVRATPSAAHVGSFQTILSETVLEAADAWTGLTLTSRAPATTTRLEGDPTVAAEEGRVVP